MTAPSPSPTPPPAVDQVREVLAERLQPFVWSTGDVDAVIAELLPAVSALLAEARADELEQSADEITAHATREPTEHITDQLIGAGQWVAAQLVTDRASSIRAAIRQTEGNNR